MSRRRCTLPEFAGKGRAIIEPGELFAKRKRIPERCVLCFFPEVLRAHRRAGRLVELQRLTGDGEPIPVYSWGRGKRAVSVCWPGWTAPFATTVMESLIALGGRKFVACGGAGVLDGSVPPGRVIVPTAALRDEGTSHHYLPPGRFVRPHPRAVEAIVAACRTRRVPFLSGPTWTTDGVFRETPGLIRRRREEGCLTVEMEAAAFFAVARFRKVVCGQLLYAGDDVSGRAWRPRGWTRRKTAREALFRLALEACRRI